MARITITNWSDQTVKFGRSTGVFVMAPGVSDYWHINGGSVYLIDPNGSSGFHAEEGDRYIVFKDHGGIYRFAYIGKDGYVATAQSFKDSKSLLGQKLVTLVPEGMIDPAINTDSVVAKNDNLSNSTMPLSQFNPTA